MQSTKYYFLVISLVMLNSTNALAVIDDNASVVLLRTSCLENGVVLNNCFEDMGSVLNWTRQTKKPGGGNPLLVEIGPGNFEEFIFCNNNFRNVTFRGAGIDQTVIGNMTLGGDGTTSTSCTDLTFDSLTVKQPSGTGYAVVLPKPGLKTTWKNVFLKGNWNEYSGACSNTNGKHYWFSSRTRGYYQTACDETWFIGSELAGLPVDDGYGGYDLKVLIATGEDTVVHVYGSTINASKINGTSTAVTHIAVQAENGANVHIHGTGIDVISATASNITALSANTGGIIHASASAYNMSTGAGGTITRIVNNGGTVRAPYVWEPQASPPNINSVTGADTAVVTGGPDPIMVIYNSACTGAGGPWYDPVAKACR